MDRAPLAPEWERAIGQIVPLAQPYRHHRPLAFFVAAAAVLVVGVGMFAVTTSLRTTPEPGGDASEGAPVMTETTVTPTTTAAVPESVTTTTAQQIPTTSLIAAESNWDLLAPAAGAEPISDDELIRVGNVVGELEPGSGFRFATSAQEDPRVEEMGIVLFVMKDPAEDGEAQFCLSDYAIRNGVRIGGGTRCSETPAEMITFGFAGSGSCLPSPEEAPQLLSLWGVPDTVPIATFEIGNDHRLIPVPVTQDGTAQLVVIGQVPVWSIAFDGITEQQQDVLDQMLPANENIDQTCGSAGGG